MFTSFTCQSAVCVCRHTPQMESLPAGQSFVVRGRAIKTEVSEKTMGEGARNVIALFLTFSLPPFSRLILTLRDTKNACYAGQFVLGAVHRSKSSNVSVCHLVLDLQFVDQIRQRGASVRSILTVVSIQRPQRMHKFCRRVIFMIFQSPLMRVKQPFLV